MLTHKSFFRLALRLELCYIVTMSVVFFVSILLFCCSIFWVRSVSSFSLLALLACQGMSLAASKDATMVIELQPKENAITGKLTAPSASDVKEVMNWIDTSLDIMDIGGAIVSSQDNQVLIHAPKKQKEKIENLKPLILKSSSLSFLPVHKQSEAIIQKPEVQILIKKYEEEKKRLQSTAKSGESLSSPINLPETLDLDDYVILEELRLDAEGKELKNAKTGLPVTSYLVLERSSSLAKKGHALPPNAVKLADPTFRRSVYIVLNDEGAKVLEDLSRTMEKGIDRLAIVINNQVITSPVMHSSIGRSLELYGIGRPKEFCISLMKPLEHDVRIVEIKED